MQSIMIDLMRMCGFDFQATTFPEFFQFVFLALCGTAVLSSIIKVMFFIAFNTHKLAK